MDRLERRGELDRRLNMKRPGRRSFLSASVAFLAAGAALGLPPAMAHAQTPASPQNHAAPGAYRVQVSLETWHDSARNRDIPVKHYQPEGAGKAPLILFSHGLGGSREAGEAWLMHWASHGYQGLALQHAGSDSALLTGGPMAMRRAMKGAMTGEQLQARLADVRFVLDELPRRTAGDPAWAGVDLTRIGLAGHSFGAVTTQAMAGERLALGPSVDDPRIKAFIALSPSARGGEALLNSRFAELKRPFLSITGTRDDGIGIGDISAANRTLPYRHMPPGDKYLLVLEGGTHMHFSGQRIRMVRTPPPLESAVKAASLAFWDAYLKADRGARTWLQRDFAASLDPADHWEYK